MANYTTDLLVVGGSLAGLAAAITAKEENPDLDVLLAEKYTTGYAGKANRGAGIMDMIGNADPEDYVKYHTHYIGEYLNDQDALRQYAQPRTDLQHPVALADAGVGDVPVGHPAVYEEVLPLALLGDYAGLGDQSASIGHLDTNR